MIRVDTISARVAAGLLLASASIGHQAMAQEAEGTGTVISNVQDNDGDVGASADFDTGLRFEPPVADANGEDVFEMFDITGDVTTGTYYTNLGGGSFGNSLNSSSSLQGLLNYLSGEPIGTSPDDGKYKYAYVPVYLTASEAGTYLIGQAEAPTDTMFFLYDGYFNPDNFTSGLVGGSNSYFSGPWSPWKVNDADFPDDVTVGACGYTVKSCPAGEIDLDDGTFYTLVLTHHNHPGRSNFTFPQSIFAEGPGSLSFYLSPEELEAALAPPEIVGSHLAIEGNRFAAEASGNKTLNSADLAGLAPAAAGVSASVISDGAGLGLDVRADHTVLNAQGNSGTIGARIDGSVAGAPARLEIASELPLNASSARIMNNHALADARGNLSDNRIAGANGAASIGIGVRQVNAAAVGADVRQVSFGIRTTSASSGAFALAGNQIAAQAVANSAIATIGR